MNIGTLGGLHDLVALRRRLEQEQLRDEQEMQGRLWEIQQETNSPAHKGKQRELGVILREKRRKVIEEFQDRRAQRMLAEKRELEAEVDVRTGLKLIEVPADFASDYAASFGALKGCILHSFIRVKRKWMTGAKVERHDSRLCAVTDTTLWICNDMGAIRRGVLLRHARKLWLLPKRWCVIEVWNAQRKEPEHNLCIRPDVKWAADGRKTQCSQADVRIFSEILIAVHGRTADDALETERVSEKDAEAVWQKLKENMRKPPWWTVIGNTEGALTSRKWLQARQRQGRPCRCLACQELVEDEVSPMTPGRGRRPSGLPSHASASAFGPRGRPEQPPPRCIRPSDRRPSESPGQSAAGSPSFLSGSPAFAAGSPARGNVFPKSPGGATARLRSELHKRGAEILAQGVVDDASTSGFLSASVAPTSGLTLNLPGDGISTSAGSRGGLRRRRLQKAEQVAGDPPQPGKPLGPLPTKMLDFADLSGLNFNPHSSLVTFELSPQVFPLTREPSAATLDASRKLQKLDLDTSIPNMHRANGVLPGMLQVPSWGGCDLKSPATETMPPTPQDFVGTARLPLSQEFGGTARLPVAPLRGAPGAELVIALAAATAAATAAAAAAAGAAKAAARRRRASVHQPPYLQQPAEPPAAAVLVDTFADAPSPRPADPAAHGSGERLAQSQPPIRWLTAPVVLPAEAAALCAAYPLTPLTPPTPLSASGTMPPPPAGPGRAPEEAEPRPPPQPPPPQPPPAPPSEPPAAHSVYSPPPGDAPDGSAAAAAPAPSVFAAPPAPAQQAPPAPAQQAPPAPAQQPPPPPAASPVFTAPPPAPAPQQAAPEPSIFASELFASAPAPPPEGIFAPEGAPFAARRPQPHPHHHHHYRQARSTAAEVGVETYPPRAAPPWHGHSARAEPPPPQAWGAPLPPPQPPPPAPLPPQPLGSSPSIWGAAEGVWSAGGAEESVWPPRRPGPPPRAPSPYAAHPAGPAGAGGGGAGSAHSTPARCGPEKPPSRQEGTTNVWVNIHYQVDNSRSQHTVNFDRGRVNHHPPAAGPPAPAPTPARFAAQPSGAPARPAQGAAGRPPGCNLNCL